MRHEIGSGLLWRKSLVVAFLALRKLGALWSHDICNSGTINTKILKIIINRRSYLCSSQLQENTQILDNDLN